MNLPDNYYQTNGNLHKITYQYIKRKMSKSLMVGGLIFNKCKRFNINLMFRIGKYVNTRVQQLVMEVSFNEFK